MAWCFNTGDWKTLWANSNIFIMFHRDIWTFIPETVCSDIFFFISQWADTSCSDIFIVDTISFYCNIKIGIITYHWVGSSGWNVQACHYIDVIMITISSQITSLTVVYSTVYSDADQRKHQSPASLAFVWGIHRDRWIPRTKGQLRGKCFHLMTSSCVFCIQIRI